MKLNKPEYNWVFTPQHAICMHAPERFAYVQFTNSLGDITPLPDLKDISSEVAVRGMLMRIYYSQHSFFSLNDKYAGTTDELLSHTQKRFHYFPKDQTLHLEHLKNHIFLSPVSIQLIEEIGFVASVAVKTKDSYEFWHIRRDGRMACTKTSKVWESKVDYHVSESPKVTSIANIELFI